MSDFPQSEGEGRQEAGEEGSRQEEGGRQEETGGQEEGGREGRREEDGNEEDGHQGRREEGPCEEDGREEGRGPAEGDPREAVVGQKGREEDDDGKEVGEQEDGGCAGAPGWSRARPSARSDDYRRLGRQVAAIALIRTGQGGRLNVRQKEELRRALLEAGEALLWDEMAVKGKNPLDAIADDLGKLTKSGIRVIEREVEADLKDKKSEMKRLVKVVEGARKLAEAKDDAFPTDISYSHTARAAAQGLVTKIETVEVTTQDEATSCADSIEKSMNRWEGLKDQMIDELQKKQALLTKLRGELPDFVKAQRTMLREVVAILH